MHARRRHRRSHEQDGAISIMAAVLVAAMVMATSLAVDVGRVAYTSRDQQGVTDRAVLDALLQLGDALPPAPSLSDVHDLVAASVATTLAGNEEGSSVGTSRDRRPERIEIGYTDPGCVYDPADPQPDHPQGFCVMWHQDGAGPYAGDYDPTPGYGESVTTVRVVTASAVDFVFGFMDDDGYRDVVKEALGTNRRTTTVCTPPPCDTELVDAEAGISIRSRLVELDSDSSPVVQQLLGDVLGMPDPTQLSLVGFDGLATAQVPLDVLADAGATAGTPDALLDSQVRLADLFTAMASADSVVGTSAETALLELASEVDHDLTVRVGDMLAATTEDPGALLAARMDALTLVMHATLNAAVADGNHLVTLQLTESDLLGTDLLGLEGLVDIDATLELIEAPQAAYGTVAYDSAAGRYETMARTAQVDLDLDLGIEKEDLATLLGPLEGLLTSLVCAALTCVEDVSVSLSVAQAEAELADIECFDPTSESDITTIVTSDALVATVDGTDETLVASHDASSSTVVIPEVPGEGSSSVDDTSLTNVAALDDLLLTVLGPLGISTGTAYVASHEVRCDVPVLLPNP